MNTTTRILLTAVLCTAAVACSKKVKEAPPPPVDTTPSAPVTDTGPTAPGAYGPDDLDTDACLRQRVVYFDLDQDALRPEFQDVVGCHAKYLRDRPSSRMTLEGNADERGSREYNLGLGERRGNSVSSAVQANGGSGSQITVAATAKSARPAPTPSEDCWAKNRRVEIIYTAQVRSSVHGNDAHVVHRDTRDRGGPRWPPHPPSAQRMSLADRVAVLEQHAANNQANVDLLSQVNQLKDEVQALRAQVEELTNAAGAGRRRRRARSTWTSTAASTGSKVERTDAGSRCAVGSRRRPPPTAATAPRRSRRTAAPAVYGDAGTLAQGAGEREAYDAAFSALKAGRVRRVGAPVPGVPRPVIPTALTRPTRCTGWARAITSPRTTSWRSSSSRRCWTATRPTTRRPGAMLKVGLSQFGPASNSTPPSAR